MSRRLPIFYDCNNCPAHCCSYDRIEVTERDLERIAEHHGVSVAVARRLYTKRAGGADVMRHQKDKVFGHVCRFLDLETRHCTIYDTRPAICRAYPGTARCGFYDFLSAERRSQEDPKHVPSFTRK